MSIDPRIDFYQAKYSLRQDIERMLQVWRAEAHEATIFYASRILEVLAGHSLMLSGLSSSENLFADLNTLQQYELISSTTRCWAHALRRLGNDVRHIRRKIDRTDSILSLVFADRCLHWFEPELDRLVDNFDGVDSLCQGLIVCPETQQIVRQIELIAEAVNDFSVDRFSELFLLLSNASSIASVLIEILIERKLHDAAQEVLAECCRNGVTSLRLRQLNVLYLSRMDRCEEAISLGEGALKEAKNDEESLGILAGAYKRLWLRTCEQRSLQRAHQLYLHGWKVSRGANHYLGVNAAATSIWLALNGEPSSILIEINKDLTQRAEKLRITNNKALGLWDQLILAECSLQLRAFDEARDRYCKAFQNYPAFIGHLDVAVTQARNLLKTFGWSEDKIDSWMAGMVSPAQSRKLHRFG